MFSELTGRLTGLESTKDRVREVHDRRGHNRPVHTLEEGAMKRVANSAAEGVRSSGGAGVRVAVCVLLLALLCTVTGFAQYTTARLSGIITDNTGSALPGATVTVEQVGTGYTQTAKTGDSGDYLFPSLPVGQYQLTVRMSGFTTYNQTGIALTVGQAASQNVTLQVGTVSQQVN